MSDRPAGTQLPRHDKLATPRLSLVASPSPAKARRRPATERPSLSTADVGPVKLPSELFALATSRSIQGDLALSKALDGIQSAATRLETERAKLVIQSQELQIWDMAREEELMLLRAENEQLEHQLATVNEKIGKGLCRDGVLESLQFALRKARAERDAEVRESDLLFNQLQEAKAAQQELQELRAALSAALSSLDDEWNTASLLAEAARELKARADVGTQDPTNLGRDDIVTLLRGLAALASRGSELQREAQTLRGENAALQDALDAAHQQVAEQAAQLLLQQGKLEDQGVRPASAEHHRPDGAAAVATASVQEGQQREAVVSGLRQQVSELQAKLSEYRSYLADNQEEIEGLQNELKRLREAQQQAGPAIAGPCNAGHGQPASQGHSHAAQGGHSRHGPTGRTGDAAGAGSSSGGAANHAADGCPRPGHPQQQPHQQQKKKTSSSLHQSLQQPMHPPQSVLGTPTRHLPTSPISTVNYGGSPRPTGSPANRGSPFHQQTAADIAQKVSELQELAVRAQQQAAEREADLALQHEQQLEGLRQVAAAAQQRADELAALAAQHAQHCTQARAQAQARELELSQQHARAMAELEEHASKLAAQHAQALVTLHGQIAQLSSQHAQALAEREAQAAQQLAQRLQQRETELQQLHEEALARQTAQAAVRQAQALSEQAARMAQQHAQELRELEARLLQEQAERQHEMEARLARQFAEQQVQRDAEMRRKNAERLAEQAAQLAKLHAEQAAAAGAQHANALADREAQLHRQFEETLLEREGQMANAHAEQMSELEARTAARAAEAAAEREAQLQLHFAEQLAEALRLQQGQLTAQAEARLEEQLAAQATQAQMSYMEEIGRLAAEHEAEMQRREGELVRQLEERRRTVEELEMLLVEAREAAAAFAHAPETASAGSTEDGDADASTDVGIATSSSDGSTAAAVALEQELSELRRQLAHVREQLEQREELLAQREKQLTQREEELEQLAQRHARDVDVALEEGERRQQAAVEALERQYVEVVARLGREHEQASMEARAASELRESNLRQALERQSREAQEARQQQEERIRELQDQLAEMRTLLEKEREAHAAVKEALRERVHQLQGELDAVRNGEAQLQPRMAATPETARSSGSYGQSPIKSSPGLPWRGLQHATPPENQPHEQQPQVAAEAPPLPSGGSPTARPPQHQAASSQGHASPKQRLLSSPPSAASAREAPMHAASVTPMQPPAAHEGAPHGSSFAASQATEDSGADAEQWPDGAPLLWPPQRSVSPLKTPRSGRQAGPATPATAGASATPAVGDAGSATARSTSPKTASPSSISRLALASAMPLYTRSEEWDRSSQQDFASRLTRAAMRVDSDGKSDGPAGRAVGADRAGMWASSESLAPRQALLQLARLSMESEGGIMLDVNSRGASTAATPSSVATPSAARVAESVEVAKREPDNAVEHSPRDLQGAWLGSASPGAPQEGVSEESEGRHQDTASEQVEEAQNDGPDEVLGEGAEGEADAEEWEAASAAPETSEQAPQPSGDGGRSSSGGACSVSTTSSYNSETECYVDDDDEEDAQQRGRALAAALAQVRAQAAPAAAPSPTAPSPPQELHRRSMNQHPLQLQQQQQQEPSRAASPAGLPAPCLPSSSSVVPAPGAGVAAVSAACAGIDLEATLSGPFPFILPAPVCGPQPVGAANHNQDAKSLRPPASASVNDGQEHESDAQSDAFMFAVLPQHATGGLETSAGAPKLPGGISWASPGRKGDGGGLHGVGGGAADAVGAVHAQPACETAAADLSASFDFSTEAHPSAPVVTATSAGGHSHSSPGAGEDEGGASNGSSNCSSMGGEVGTPFGGYPEHEPSVNRGAGSCGSWGSGLAGPGHGEHESPEYSAVAALSGVDRRSSVGTTNLKPLMLTNPLYEGDADDESSPPWSTADWDNDAAENGNGRPREDGVSVTSTPHGCGPQSPSNRNPSSGCSSPAENPSSAASSGTVLTGDELEADTPDPWVTDAVPLSMLGSSSVHSSLCSRGDSPGRYQLPALLTSPTRTTAHQTPGSTGPHSGFSGADCSEVEHRWRHEAGGGSDPRVDHDRSRLPLDRRAAESGEAAAVGDQNTPWRTEAGADADEVEMLAAGISLGSSEVRRRQRRRMGDAQPLACHPVDLLRQSWSFSHGVATPLSPRSAMNHGRVQGHVVGHTEPTSPTPPSAGSCSRMGASSPGSDTPSLQLQPAPHSLLQLAQESPRLLSPKRVTSTPKPPVDATPARISTTPAGHTPAAPGLLLAVTHGASSSSPGSGTASAAAQDGVSQSPVSSQDVRQQGRAVLGRVLGRVAHLEGHCRALAAHHVPGSAAGTPWHSSAGAGPGPLPEGEGGGGGGEGFATMTSGAFEALVSGLQLAEVQPNSGPGDSAHAGQSPSPPPALTAAVGTRDGGSTPPLEGNEASSTDGGNQQPQEGTQRPVLAASVLGALEELRGDLFELEKLHRLSLKSAVSTHGSVGRPGLGPLARSRTPGSAPAAQEKGSRSPDGVAGPGVAGSGEGGKAPGAMLAGSRTAGESLGGTGGGDGGRAWQLHPLSPQQQPAAMPGAAGLSTSAAFLDASLLSVKVGAPARGSSVTATVAGALEPCSPALPTPPPHVLQGAPAAAALAAAGPGLQPVGSSSAPSTTAAAAAAAPSSPPLSPSFSSPLPASSLDPALVSLLQASIQTQLQGQLGQLQAKVEELQRQNQALMAATGSTTPPSSAAPRADDGGSAASTPAHVATALAFAASPTAVGAGVGYGNGGSRGGEGSGVRWSAGIGSVMWPAAHGLGVGLGSGESGSRGLADMGRLLGAPQSPWARSSQAANTTAHMSMEAPAGPFSPEELSQLPPSLQLFAPPQLRAAAVAAAHDSART